MDFEEKQKKDILEAIKNNSLFDFIASNYWRIENDLLIQLLKECIYTMNLNNDDTKKQLIENLNEFEGWAETQKEKTSFLKCDSCGVCGADVKKVINPYNKEINNIIVYNNMCVNCYNESIADI